ncbi:MAG: DUF1298 domain-containing protein [Acidimicrobiia bacterium]|nr:DUF1298 domain-containing protein [Acidimicrobiia bacterium]
MAPPGEPRQVLDLLALVEAASFDPGQPPWDVTLIGGLEGGRSAVYLRAHHVLTDGFGGRSLVSLLLDGVPPHPGAEGRPGARRRPGTATVTLDPTSAWRPVATALSAALDLDPVHAVARRVQRGIDVAGSLSHQVMPQGEAGPSLPPSRSATGYFGALSVPGARTTALALGGSRNDLLVAAAATGLGRYLELVGSPADELRLAMPVGRRRSRGAADSRYAPARVGVPAAARHPGAHFGVVAERLARARREPALRIAGALAPAISRLPALLLVPALQAHAAGVDFVATALPGLRGTRRLCGVAVEESYPFGPRLGCPMNVTAFGNEDRLDVGVTLSPAAVTEPGALLDCLAAAFAELSSTSTEGPVPAAPRA